MSFDTVYIVEIDAYIQATSTSTISVGTGAKTFTLAAYRKFIPGMTIAAIDGTGRILNGTVTSQSTTTLVVNITSTSGAGSASSWTIGGLNTFYYADGKGFITKPSETPANTVFENRVNNPGNYERHMFSSGTTGGVSEVGYGVVELNNADGALDGFLEYGLDGRALTIRKGTQSSAYPSGFTTLFKGTMQQANHTWLAVTLLLRDKLTDVANKPIQSVRYAGTNALPAGEEGVATDIGGKPKPRLRGKVEGLEPICTNTSLQMYQISVEQLASIQAVRVREVAITPGTNRTTLALLEAAVPAAGAYDWYLGAGGDGAFIKLTTTPDGAVRVDATQGATAADRTVAQIFKSIMTDATAGGLSLSDIDTTSITALDTLNSNVVGFYIGTDEATVHDTLDMLFASIGAFWTQDRVTGKFVVGQLVAPTGSPVTTFKSWAFEDADSGLSIIASSDPSSGLPVYRVNLNYRKYFSPVTDADIAGSVGLVQRSLATNQFRSVVSTDLTVQTKNLLAPEKNVDTLLTDPTDAANEASRLLTLFKTRRDIVQVEVASSLTTGIDINSLVSIDVPRYTWSGGKLFRVIGMIEEYNIDRVTLILWG